MIPMIGLMIAFYIIERMSEVLTNRRTAHKVLAAIAILASVVGIWMGFRNG